MTRIEGSSHNKTYTIKDLREEIAKMVKAELTQLKQTASGNKNEKLVSSEEPHSERLTKFIGSERVLKDLHIV